MRVGIFLCQVFSMVYAINVSYVEFLLDHGSCDLNDRLPSQISVSVSSCCVDCTNDPRCKSLLYNQDNNTCTFCTGLLPVEKDRNDENMTHYVKVPKRHHILLERQDIVEQSVTTISTEISEITRTIELSKISSSTELSEISSSTERSEISSSTELSEISSSTALSVIYSSTELSMVPSYTEMSEMTRTTQQSDKTSSTELSEMSSSTEMSEMTTSNEMSEMATFHELSEASISKLEVTWEAFENSSYAYVSVPRKWPEAEIACRTLGSNMVTINSLAELTFLHQTLKDDLDKIRTWVRGFWFQEKPSGITDQAEDEDEKMDEFQLPYETQTIMEHSDDSRNAETEPITDVPPMCNVVYRGEPNVGQCDELLTFICEKSTP